MTVHAAENGVGDVLDGYVDVLQHPVIFGDLAHQLVGDFVGVAVKKAYPRNFRFCRYAADKLGKTKTMLQDISIFILIIYEGFEGIWGEHTLRVVYYAGLIIFALSIIMAIVSAVHYFYINAHALDESKAVSKVEHKEKPSAGEEKIENEAIEE